LASFKIDRKDSFSNVVKRHFKSTGKATSGAGSWSDMSDEEVDGLRKETLEVFSFYRESLRRTDHARYCG